MEINQIRRTNLQALVDTIGLATFAEKVGRSKTQISSLTTGWRNLGERLAREFEKSLGLEEGYFDRANAQPEKNLKTILDQVRVPLVTWESLLSDDSGEPIGIVMASTNIPSTSLALSIRDRSMQPLFDIGDIVIIAPGKKAEPSSLVVAIADGEAVLRKYKAVSKDVFELVPLNSDFPTLSSSTSEIIIKGVAIELRKSLSN